METSISRIGSEENYWGGVLNVLIFHIQFLWIFYLQLVLGFKFLVKQIPETAHWPSPCEMEWSWWDAVGLFLVELLYSGVAELFYFAGLLRDSSPIYFVGDMYIYVLHIVSLVPLWSWCWQFLKQMDREKALGWPPLWGTALWQGLYRSGWPQRNRDWTWSPRIPLGRSKVNSQEQFLGIFWDTIKRGRLDVSSHKLVHAVWNNALVQLGATDWIYIWFIRVDVAVWGDWILGGWDCGGTFSGAICVFSCLDCLGSLVDVTLDGPAVPPEILCRDLHKAVLRRDLATETSYRDLV